MQGNTEQDKVVTNDLNPAIHMARFVRIHPKTWQNHISLRFEVLGCEVTGNHILQQAFTYDINLKYQHAIAYNKIEKF